MVITDGKLSDRDRDRAPADAPSRQVTALGDVAVSVLLGLVSSADASATASGSLPSPADVNALADAADLLLSTAGLVPVNEMLQVYSLPDSG